MEGCPILQNYRSRMLYAGIWILITGIQTLVVYVASDLSAGYALIDSFVFNALFAIYALLLWFPVYYNPRKNKSWILNFVFLKFLAVLLLLVWLGSGCLLMHVFFGENTAYLHFVYLSLWWKIIEGLLLYTVVVLVYYLYIYIEQLNEKASNEIHLQQLLKDGELNLLKSQINPHFLFNSLNSLNALILHNPSQAQEMLVALSDYLRYTVLSTRAEQAGVEEEINNIERYLSIEKRRFGDKLKYNFEVAPNCLSLKIPAMLLQPLFENAIKHGVYESTQAVQIDAVIKREGHYLHIEISNDFDSDNTASHKESGTGLKNISERLRLSYGSNAFLQIKSGEGKYTAILKIPV